jgi:hypothetical protein
MIPDCEAMYVEVGRLYLGNRKLDGSVWAKGSFLSNFLPREFWKVVSSKIFVWDPVDVKERWEVVLAVAE